MQLVTNFSIAQISMRIVEYNQVNASVLIDISCRPRPEKKLELIVLTEIYEGSKKIALKSDTFSLNSKNAFKWIKDLRVHCDTIACSEKNEAYQTLQSFKENTQKVVVKLYRVNNTLIDSSSSFFYFKPSNIVWDTYKDSIVGKVTLASGLENVSAFIGVLMFEHDSLPKYSTWSNFSSEGRCKFYLADAVEMGYRPKFVAAYLITDSVDKYVDGYLLQKGQVKEFTLKYLDQDSTSTKHVLPRLTHFYNFESKFKIPKIKVGGNFVLSGYRRSGELLNDSTPEAAIDLGANLNLSVGGIPLKVSSLQSTQHDFMGNVNQRTVSIDFEQLKKQLLSTEKLNLDAQSPNLGKEVLSAEKEIEKRKKQIKKDKLPSISQQGDSLLAKTTNNFDSLNQIYKKAALDADNALDELTHKQDSIKQILGKPSSMRQNLLNKFKYLDDFSIGRIAPFFSKFTVNATPIDGISVGVKLPSVKAAFFNGTTVPFSFGTLNQPLENWQMRGLKFEKQLSKEHQVELSGLRAILTALNPERQKTNYVSQIGHHFKSESNGLNAEIQFASAVTRNYRLGILGSRNESLDYAWSADVNYEFKQLSTQVGLFAEQVSDNYFSAGNPFLRRAYAEVALYAQSNFFNGVLLVKTKWLLRRQHFILNNNRRSTGEIDLKLRKRPWAVSFKYKPMTILGAYTNGDQGLVYIVQMANITQARLGYDAKFLGQRINASLTYIHTLSRQEGLLMASSEIFNTTVYLTGKKWQFSIGGSAIQTGGIQVSDNLTDALLLGVFQQSQLIFGNLRYKIGKNWQVSIDSQVIQGISTVGTTAVRVSHGLGVNKRIGLINFGLKSNYFSQSEHPDNNFLTQFNCSVSF